MVEGATEDCGGLETSGLELNIARPIMRARIREEVSFRSRRSFSERFSPPKLIDPTKRSVLRTLSPCALPPDGNAHCTNPIVVRTTGTSLTVKAGAILARCKSAVCTAMTCRPECTQKFLVVHHVSILCRLNKQPSPPCSYVQMGPEIQDTRANGFVRDLRRP